MLDCVSSVSDDVLPHEARARVPRLPGHSLGSGHDLTLLTFQVIDVSQSPAVTCANEEYTLKMRRN